MGLPTFGTGSWLGDFVRNLTGDKNGPGQAWSSYDAKRAFARGQINSRKESGKSVRVGFRNNSNLPLLLVWVADNGTCHHFYTLKPAQIMEGPVNALDHIENTCLGDAFCIAQCPSDQEMNRMKKDQTLDPKYVVGGYRPDALATDDDQENKKYTHLVTISQQPTKNYICCKPPSHNLRGSTDNDNNDSDDLCWVVQASHSQVDDKQINTCETKTYEKSTLGGWPVYLEPNWHDGDASLEKKLAQDLENAAKLLPQHAREFLRKNTPVYVNKTFCWGPEICPINGRGCVYEYCIWIVDIFTSYCFSLAKCLLFFSCCFHPEKNWLEENLMHPEKCECVEIYSAKEYFQDCAYWGRAGVLVHEFSHAYHHKCLDKGYDNDEIKACYDQAMKDRLYDWIRVHGPQGPMNKGRMLLTCASFLSFSLFSVIGSLAFCCAHPTCHSQMMIVAYAATNRMEYFAELSAAFLGQPDMRSDEEFNKWYPFNRRQIKEHDPRAYEMLKKIWKVD